MSDENTKVELPTKRVRRFVSHQIPGFECDSVSLGKELGLATNIVSTALGEMAATGCLELTGRCSNRARIYRLVRPQLAISVTRRRADVQAVGRDAILDRLYGLIESIEKMDVDLSRVPTSALLAELGKRTA